MITIIIIVYLTVVVSFKQLHQCNNIKSLQPINKHHPHHVLMILLKNESDYHKMMMMMMKKMLMMVIKMMLMMMTKILMMIVSNPPFPVDILEDRHASDVVSIQSLLYLLV